MVWLELLALIIVGCFGFVLLVGPPYLPTLSRQVAVAIELADLKPGQTLLELGCGDGRVLIAAAQKGWKAVGYELNPIMALVARIRTWRYRRQVKVVWGNFWRQDWPPAEAIFGFILSRYMKKLDTKIMQLQHKPIKLVSFAFEIPGRQPATVREGVYLYEYR